MVWNWGFQRSTQLTMDLTPDFLTASTIWAVPSGEVLAGFSMTTCRPLSAARLMYSARVSACAQCTTMSMRLSSRSASTESNSLPSTPCVFIRLVAFSGVLLYMPTIWVRG